MNRWTTVGLALLVGWLTLGVLAVLPPAETHHHFSRSDDVELHKLPPTGSLEALVDPALDFYKLVAPKTAEGHYPFPKVCAHYNFTKPNHTYYFDNHWWNDGRHIHTGDMGHALGAD